MQSRNNQGFTLIELMVVVAIVGVLGGVAMLNMISWRGERQLDGAARAFYSNMQLARLAAIREAVPVSVVLNTAAGSYQIFIDINQNYILDTGNPNPSLNDRELRNITLPSGITVQASTFGGNRTRFDNRGRPNVIGTLTLQNTAGSTETVVINRVGRLRIQ